MREEIHSAKQIAKSIAKYKRKGKVDYILSPYNDPDFSSSVVCKYILIFIYVGFQALDQLGNLISQVVLFLKTPLINLGLLGVVIVQN